MTTPLLIRFVAEARELLQLASSGLLALEKNPGDEAVVNNVFRSVHTLKGSSGLFEFVALTKLVHAGEDVLSAVRAGQLSLTSELVDLLLDALDRIGAWIDDIEHKGRLSDGADGVSRDMTAALRGWLPALPDASGPAQEAPRRAAAVEILDVDWLARIDEAARLEAFRACAQGHALLAIEYVPVEDCFFSGEDPVNLMRQIPALHGLLLEGTEPWPDLDTLDPYRCALRLRAISAAPQTSVEELFRYVIEQVAITPVAAHQLAVLAGEADDNPVYEDFVEEARDLSAKGDWSGLKNRTQALLNLTGSTLFAASALRWLDALLDVPAPDPSQVAVLIAAVIDGEAPPLPAPASTVVSASGRQERTAVEAGATVKSQSFPSSANPASHLSPIGREILEAQRFILESLLKPEMFPGQIGSIRRTVANVISGVMEKADCAAWSAACDASEAAGTGTAALAELNRILGSGAEVGAEVGATEIAQADASATVHDQRQAPARILKVDQAKIDTLMNLIGEMVVSKNTLPFLARRAENVHGSREMAREIKDIYAVIDRLSQEMQAAIMAVRMLPVSEVLDRFPRLVRDVARKLGKRVELVIEGEDTAADKNIVEVLSDPLLHIVRNSLDHGIETPEQREAAGKNPDSILIIRAFQEGDQVVIEVQDDGCGIDPAKIRAAAVAKGLMDAERAARLSDQEAINLVFAAGFSTAASVSDLSGRGVGMDVVVTTVEKAGGSVALNSVKGVGTTVRISLPLSMAVTRVMMVEAGGGMLFGIPMEHIAETVRIPRSRVKKIKQSESFVLRDTIVPLLRLDALLGVPQPLWFGDADQEEAVLVVKINGALTGLVVDHFREGMDIILKPFDGILSGIGGYAGTALLGDGRVLLVLNLKELV
ncbi:MAG TPA: chemotaxis protein CheA [Azospirillaceae bacterium]|nr:chemotaxis protein CheA [Azospirillaceae bacterium]HRQ79723.1 chemotaxis protein CheA [Azospirillaceae bacterium]